MQLAKKATVTVLISGMSFLSGVRVHAQTVLKVTAVQQVAEKRSGGAWHAAHRGTLLAVGDAFRTRKRSKADLKFGDGSLLRLGQLSTLEVQSHKTVRLSQGQVFFSNLGPGYIVAGSATAEIKGSSGVVTVRHDGSSEVTLFSGALQLHDLLHPGRLVPVRPGYSASVLPGGGILALRRAAPLAFAGGQLTPDLLVAPSTAPFAGSTANVAARNAPDRISLEQAANSVPASGQVRTDGLPYIPKRSVFGHPAAAGVANTAAVNGSAEAGNLATTRVLARDDASTAPTDLGTQQLQDIEVNAATPLEVDAATRHVQQQNQNNGSERGVEADVLGAVGDEGVRSYGGRIRGFATSGHLFADAALLGMRVSSFVPGRGRRTADFSTLSHGFLAYRGNFGDVQVGRQRFVEGPTQASLFGSLVRQNGRDTMDALRFRPRLGNDKVKLDMAYLQDAFPHNLPYTARGSQHGLYGRAAVQLPAGNFGVNIVKYRDLRGLSSTGISGDFALPLAHDAVEVYGEVGRDAARRRMATVGLTVPRLFQRSDYEAYVEYSTLGKPGVLGAPRLPRELTLRLFRRVTEAFGLVAQASHFSRIPGFRADNVVTVGFQFGAMQNSGDVRD